jgi:hypothetical protein
MKIGPSGFCIPVPNGCTALRHEAVFKKSPNPSDKFRVRARRLRTLINHFPSPRFFAL